MKYKKSDFFERNPDNYKWGIFYYNPQDERIVVSKINPGLGWTLNFAKPKAYWILVGIIALMATGIFIAKNFG